MQEADKALAKAHLLEKVAYQIRGPINELVATTSHLLCSAEISCDDLRHAEHIKDASDRLILLTNRIVDFAHLLCGEVSLEKTQVSVVTLVEEAIDIFIDDANHKGIYLCSFVDFDIPANLTGDTGRLRQVLLNLMDNAIKFTRQGGVSVSASLLQDSEDSCTVKFEITDSGSGIDPKEQERLLNALALQAEGDNLTDYSKCGLGLAISQILIGMMGGILSLVSSPGQGSVITFTVPFARQPAADPQNKKLNGHVLLVSSEPSTAEFLSKQLANMGLKVSHTDDGLTALNLLENQSATDAYHIVIVDICFSTSDILTFLRRMARDYTKERPKMLLTSLQRAHYREPTQEALASGFDDYLSMPVKQSQLFTTLQWLLRGAKAELHPIKNRIHPQRRQYEREQKRKYQVLLVEENLANQEVVQTLVNRFGYHCSLASTGKDAKLVFDLGKYALILMDCDLPDNGGFNAAEEIRQLNTAKKVTIIGMSSKASKERKKLARDAGITELVAKPVTCEVLSQTLKKWLPE